jgi:hypothetical protein
MLDIGITVDSDSGGGQRRGPDARRTSAEAVYLPILETIAAILADGFDHPEVWRAVASSADHDVGDLRALLAGLLPTQAGDGRKTCLLIAGMLHALTVDRGEGHAMLHRLLIEHPHCPQVAGAIFFIARHGQPGPSADLSSRFCDAPFVKFETLMDGTVAPCCSIWTGQRLGQLDGQTAEAIWNSAAAQAMRASILDGSFRHCNKLRCSHIGSDTLPEAAAVTDPAMRRIIDEGLTRLDTGPRWLFLAHDVTCNLGCPSCRDGILAADETQTQRFDVIQRDVLQPLLAAPESSAVPPVQLSLSGQGDPWSSPHYRSILRYLADHDLRVTLDLHTNALLMTEQRWSGYAGLDRYRALVNVSIDACTPWVYEIVRRPGKWDKLLPNLKFIAAKRARSEFREFHINTTVQLDNYHEMAGFVALAQSLGADSARLYMIQNTGGHFGGDYARKNIADAGHPLHLAFLEVLRHPSLGLAIAHLYDVANWRAHAFETALPSDALPHDFTRSDLDGALRDSVNRPHHIVALCAAGRIRFPHDLDLPLHEARALQALGFAQQAGFRLRERVALGGEAIVLAGSCS